MENDIKYFNDIKSYMKFIMNFNGELTIKGSNIYFNNSKIAIFKK